MTAAEESESGKSLAKQVREANRRLYDGVASNYELVDGRRSARTSQWLKRRLSKLRAMAPGGALLDVGCGAGFISRSADGVFDLRIGADISPKILAANASSFTGAVACEVERLPFVSGSFDAAVAFATLHHLFEYSSLCKELARVLKPGGVFYSDHDMDERFFKRFKIPLSVYRAFRGAGRSYSNASDAIDGRTYALSEFHGDGIPTGEIVKMLEGSGFSVSVEFHWFGLSPLADAVFKERTFARGFAPVASIWAVRR